MGLELENKKSKALNEEILVSKEKQLQFENKQIKYKWK